MKILMIAPQPFFEPRGTPISVRQRLTGLIKLGHQVDLATYSLGENIDLPGLKIYRTPSIPGIKTLKVGPSWQKIPLDFLLVLRSIGLLFSNKYDVIHTHEEAGFFSVFLAWFPSLGAYRRSSGRPCPWNRPCRLMLELPHWLCLPQDSPLPFAVSFKLSVVGEPFFLTAVGRTAPDLR